MPSIPPVIPAERQNTDQSLGRERGRTDEEFGRLEDSFERADAILKEARARADEVLTAAREKADQELMSAGSLPPHVLRQDRAREDAALAEERLAAEHSLGVERLQRTMALERLLRVERAATDEALLVERARSDTKLASGRDFQSMVSHDVRSLLGAIILNAESAIKTAGDDEAGRRCRGVAEKTQRLVARIDRLVGDLIDVASMESGRFSVEPREHDARAVVQASLEVFQPLASAKGVSLSLALGKDSLPARFDYERILQVLANLLSNAIKYAGKGGAVSLRLERAGSQLQFYVTDTGPGIASEHQESVFERFWQAPNKVDSHGVGLGLFISKGIIETHGGRIWVESGAGKGSTFCFTLPAAPLPEAETGATVH